jgi:hypothetical protein
MENRSIMERLEEKIVFRISRVFFIVLVFLAMVGMLWGVYCLCWSITPTSKSVVIKEADPKPVFISSLDIKDAINKVKIKKDSSNTTKEPIVEEKKENDDPDKIKYQQLCESIKILFPENLYTWKSKGHWYYPYAIIRSTYGKKWIVDKHGVEDIILSVLNGESEYKKGIIILEQLFDVLKSFPDKERLEPLQTFAMLYNDRKYDYEKLVRENEMRYEDKLNEATSNYEKTIAEKSAARYKGMLISGGGIASIASLAIFLVLLSVQRNIKKLVLKEKDSK